jgi:hypothetical protein
MAADSAAVFRLMSECEPLASKRLKREHASRPSSVALAPLRPFLNTLERVASVLATQAGASASAPDAPLLPPQLTVLVPYCQSSLEFTVAVRPRHSASAALAADDAAAVDIDVSIPAGSKAAATLGGCHASAASSPSSPAALLGAWHSDASNPDPNTDPNHDASSLLRVLLSLRSAHARRVEARLRALRVPAVDALIAQAREFVRESDRASLSASSNVRSVNSDACMDEDVGASAAAAAANETASAQRDRAADMWSRVMRADVQFEFDDAAGQVCETTRSNASSYFCLFFCDLSVIFL